MRSCGAACVLPAALLLWAGEVRAQTDVEVWSATLTRGSFPNEYGYDSTRTPTAGSLTSTTFTYADVDYTVRFLFVSTSVTLGIGTDPLLPVDTGLKLRLPTFKSTETTDCPVGGTVDIALSGLESRTFGSRGPGLAGYTGNFPCLDDWEWAQNLETTGTVALLGPLVVPAITGTAVTSTPMLESDTYGRGERIEFTVTFDHPVNVTGDPRFPFQILSEEFEVGVPGRGEVFANYESGSGSTSLVFAYTVQQDDRDSNGIHLWGPDRSLELDSDDAIEGTGAGTPDATVTLVGSGTWDDHKVDGSRPADPPPDDDDDGSDPPPDDDDDGSDPPPDDDDDDPDPPPDDDDDGSDPPPDDDDDPAPVPVVPAAGLLLLAALLAAGGNVVRRSRPPR